jgi:hypothetical protein
MSDLASLLIAVQRWPDDEFRKMFESLIVRAAQAEGRVRELKLLVATQNSLDETQCARIGELEVENGALREEWLRYSHPTLSLCSLCGNTGVIDTRGRAISPAGYDAGMRHYCLCPNGRAMRETDPEQKRIREIS